MYRGEEWERNQDFVDALRAIAESLGATVAQLVVLWTLEQPGITSVLCGAKRAWQIEETVGALGLTITTEQRLAIDEAIRRRGRAEAKWSFR